jgi:hypothetical protein
VIVTLKNKNNLNIVEYSINNLMFKLIIKLDDANIASVKPNTLENGNEFIMVLKIDN